jgi:hypothetical protein
MKGILSCPWDDNDADSQSAEKTPIESTENDSSADQD